MNLKKYIEESTKMGTKVVKFKYNNKIYTGVVYRTTDKGKTIFLDKVRDENEIEDKTGFGNLGISSSAIIKD